MLSVMRDMAIDLEHETSIRDYITLLKPRVMVLVVFTGLAGMLLTPDFSDMHIFTALMAMVALTFGAGAAGAINMWYDRDIDAQMTRTSLRPIPAGRILADSALDFALILSFMAVALMALATNWLAAAILAFANIFYAVIYTMWLKRSTSQNIVIGGAAGAFPPVIGWVAVTGSMSWEPLVLFAIIFLWTPPHFWALALISNEDYKRANIPMLPVIKGARHTKWQMFVYTIILTPFAILPMMFDGMHSSYGIVAAVFSVGFVLSAWRVLKAADNDHKPARQMFVYSIFYLFGLFLALILQS